MEKNFGVNDQYLSVLSDFERMNPRSICTMHYVCKKICKKIV